MQARTQQWWLAGGLVLAFLSGGSALQSSVYLAQAIQKLGHGSQLQAGYGIGGKPIAGVVWGDQPVAVIRPHTPSVDGYGIGGKTIAGFGISGQPVAGVIWSGKPVAVVDPHRQGSSWSATEPGETVSGVIWGT